MRRRGAVPFAAIVGLVLLGVPATSAGAPSDTMSVSCINWFLSGGHQDHIHVELYVEDGLGNPVVGATVRFETSYDTHDGAGPRVYATVTDVTRDRPGKNRASGCDDPKPMSGSTGWFCCIGAAKWSGEQPPGQRACPSGFFHAEVLSVDPPPETNLVWDGVSPANGREFTASHA